MLDCLLLQEAARLMASGDYEAALPVSLEAVTLGEQLFKPQPALQLFPLYLLAAQVSSSSDAWHGATSTGHFSSHYSCTKSHMYHFETCHCCCQLGSSPQAVFASILLLNDLDPMPAGQPRATTGSAV